MATASLAEPLTSEPIRPLEMVERPTFDMPAGACDSHIHIFGPLNRYPSVAHPHYTLPPGDLGHWRAVMERLGLQRFVIVQPSFYDTDNRCLLDALGASGDAARGVAMVDEDVTAADLRDMDAQGVRALRLDLFKRRDLPRPALETYVAAMAERVAPLGWHLQFYAPGPVVRDLLGFLAGLEVDFVIDHMGYMLEKDGLTSDDFARLLALAQTPRCWIKLSAPYRLAGDGGYAAVAGTARAIVAAAPERAIWGSDWPHIPLSTARDTGGLLNLMADWAPDPEVRRMILADNAARLFDWGRG